MTAVIDCFQAAHSALGIHIKSGNSAVLYGKSFFKRSLPLQKSRKHTAEHSAVADHRHTFQLMAAHLAPYLLCQKNASLKSLHAAFSPRRSSLSGFPPPAAVLFWKLPRSSLPSCRNGPPPALSSTKAARPGFLPERGQSPWPGIRDWREPVPTCGPSCPLPRMRPAVFRYHSVECLGSPGSFLPGSSPSVRGGSDKFYSSNPSFPRLSTGVWPNSPVTLSASTAIFIISLISPVGICILWASSSTVASRPSSSAIFPEIS